MKHLMSCHKQENVLLRETPRWEHFSHSSDIGIRGMGPSLETAFEQAALALIAVMTDPDKILTPTSVSINIESPNTEILLLDWLNELIFKISTHNIIFGKFSISIQGAHLTATASGEALSQRKHAPAVEIKGATMTELAVFKDISGTWIAQCVLDV